MFMVYSPEGRSHHAMINGNRDRSKQVVSVQAYDSDELDSEPQAFRQHKALNHGAINAYHQTGDAVHSRVEVVRISEIMSSPVVTIDSKAALVEAWEVMNGTKVHHLPVLNALGQLIGIVTAHDLLFRTIVSSDGKIEEVKNESVEDVMVAKVVTTLSNTPVRKVAKVMNEQSLGCLPIVSKQGALEGIVTISDMLKRLSAEPPLALYA